MGRTLKLAFIYLSGVIGAGFITGRELYSYFGRYGVLGLAGVVLSFVLFLVTGLKISRLAAEKDCRDLISISAEIMGEKGGKAVCIMISAFLYCMYVVMTAGASELLTQYTGLSPWTAGALTTVICICLLVMGFQRLASVCAFIAPATAVIMLAVLCFSGSFERVWQNMERPCFGFPDNIIWIGAAVVYCGYNLLVLLSVIPRASRKSDSLKTLMSGNGIGALSVGILVFFVTLGIIGEDPEGKFSMPLLHAAGEHSAILKFIMVGCVFVTMMLSCAVNLSNCGKELAERFCFKEFPVATALALSGCLISFAGFGKLMDILYTFFGVLGVFLILPLVFRRK